MQSLLETFLVGNVFAFLLTFTRMGAAIMIMPGIGDTFTPVRIRLLMALGISFVLFPLTLPFVPYPLPGVFEIVSLVMIELVIGIFIGTVSRIFSSALDTAGMVASTQSGLANAQVFNPTLAQQGSIIGAFLTVTGIALIFTSNLHHMLIIGLMDSYQLFPFGELPVIGDMSDFIAKAVNMSFQIGIKLAMPFLVITLLMYVGMGVLSRLMPQIQVIQVVLPLQILISSIVLSLIASALFYTWLKEFEEAMMFFLNPQ
ncbi:MAG: flagellar biosynthetic protein FliR [Alphaproteobacteria bacterium]|nr:flagellar biosynthetic protein FliR [Alphaproteobacteria bacterium]